MISLIISLAVVGLIVYLIVTYIPMAPPFKTAITIIALVCCILYVLYAFGLWHGVHNIPVPSMHER